MNYFLSLKFPTRSLLETQTAGFERAVLLGNQISTAGRLDAQLGRFAQFQIISFRRVTVGTDAIRVGLPVLTVLTCSQMNKKNVQLNRLFNGFSRSGWYLWRKPSPWVHVPLERLRSWPYCIPIWNRSPSCSPQILARISVPKWACQQSAEFIRLSWNIEIFYWNYRLIK